MTAPTMPPKTTSSFDVVVIGGGFYGCSLAELFAKAGRRVCLLERETDLLRRASATNQARVHNGYHYPRSFPTAVRSHVNFQRFCADFPQAISRNFTKIYAISRNRSKVSARQFSRFCELIGAPLKIASGRIQRLFDPDSIEEAFEVEEFAFDHLILRDILRRRLDMSSVEIRTSTTVQAIDHDRPRPVVHADRAEIKAKLVLNCTYSGINSVLNGSETLQLKHELTELALIHLPDELRDLGITIMDGPFFSVMPFPSRSLHSLTHVRYTPHASWVETGEAGEARRLPPPESLHSRYAHMLADAKRYLPLLAQSRYATSIYEIKTILPQNEVDDGRPILLKRHGPHGRVFSVLGGKLDNIYDIFAKVQEQGLLDG